MTEQPTLRDLHDRATELIEAYSLDALAPDEAALVDAHLDDGCEDCEEEVSRFRSVVDKIPLGLPQRPAPPELKQRVLMEVEAARVSAGSGPATAPRQMPLAAAAGGEGRGRLSALVAPWRPARFASMAASVAVLAVVGLVGWNVVLQSDVSDLDSENEALLTTVATVEEQQRNAETALVSAQEEAAGATARSLELEARMTAIVTVMSSDDQQHVSLAGTSEAPNGAWGNMLLNPADGTFVVLASGLDAGVEGGYVLWVHTSDGKAIPITFFSVDALGNGVGYGRLEGDLGEAAVTISHEYDRNVSAPSGAVKLQRRR